MAIKKVVEVWIKIVKKKKLKIKVQKIKNDNKFVNYFNLISFLEFFLINYIKRNTLTVFELIYI